MYEFVANWGTVPVYISPLDDEFWRDFVIEIVNPANLEPMIATMQPEYEGFAVWHEKQAKAAIHSAIYAQPDGLKILPEKGFYAVVYRRRALLQLYRGEGETFETLGFKPYARAGIAVLEDLSGVDTGRRTVFPREVIDTSISADLDSLGGELNSYPALFLRLIDDLPRRWADWVAWRRFKRWKPVPDWLVKLRAENRKRKQSSAA
jgi:hypothetical protein